MASIRQVKKAGRGSTAHGLRPVKTAALRSVRGVTARRQTGLSRRVHYQRALSGASGLAMATISGPSQGAVFATISGAGVRPSRFI